MKTISTPLSSRLLLLFIVFSSMALGAIMMSIISTC